MASLVGLAGAAGGAAFVLGPCSSPRGPSQVVAAEPASPFEAAAAAGVSYATRVGGAVRALRYWLPRTDPRTGLTPNFLPEYALGIPKKKNSEGPMYSPADSGADHYPFQVITEWLIAERPDAHPLTGVLAAEKRWATYPDGLLAEWLDLTKGELGPRSVFAGAEYAKDGLLSVTGLLGQSPWQTRMVEVIDAILANLDSPSNYGMLPGTGAEIHGDMLLVLVPLAWMTGEARYAEVAKRIADAWFFEVLPGNHGLPSQAWNFETHQGISLTQLRDHGNEIIAGLVLYVAYLHGIDPERAERDYLPAARTMIDRVLESANEDGLLYNRIDSSSLAPKRGQKDSDRLTDNWGYVYGAVYNLFLLTGDQRYREATLHVMGRLPRYLDHDWSTYPGHDDWADVIESAIYLLAHEDVPETRTWLAAMIERLSAFQKPSGVIGASYLDGNFMRTSLLYAQYLAKGVIARPWREGLRLGAVLRQGALHVAVSAAAGAPWQGTLAFDTPRHKTIFHMPRRFVRLNEWPEWFTAAAGATYELRRPDGTQVILTADELTRGIPVSAPDAFTLTRRAP